MGKKVFVGSLPYSINEQKLAELFAPYGSVESVKIISDRFSGQPKGFGFVEMASSEEAQKAIAALNGTQFEERTLVVNEARPMESRPHSPKGGHSSGGKGRRDRRF